MPDLTQYLLPDAPCSISFSGGRSSGFMLHHILAAHDGVLPDNVKVLFANTGKERPETLDFIHECAVRWNCPVIWLEYRFDANAAGGIKDPKHIAIEVDYETASRNGEPFESMIWKTSAGFLPNPVQRSCTSELKILTMQRYLRRVHGWKKWHSILGLRGDEPRRLTQNVTRYEYSRIYPMACDGITHPDVKAWWKRQPFDLTITSEQGNCDLCFLKGRRKLVQLIRDDPSIADWWINVEKQALLGQTGVTRKVQFSRFNKDFLYTDLVKEAECQTELDFPDDQQIDCFCTD